MIVLTKSFKKQLQTVNISTADVIIAIDRVLNKHIFRTGDTLLPNAILKLSNCLLAKMRVGQKQQARMLVVFMIVKNLKIPFFVTNKNDKRLGGNISLATMKNIIAARTVKILDEFHKGEFEQIDE